MEMTLNTKIGVIEGLKDLEKYLIYSKLPESAPEYPSLLTQSPAEMQEMAPAWQARGILSGVKMLQEYLEEGRQLFYPVYSPQECEDDPQKADVGVWFFPAKNKKKDAPFIISCAGGAYQAVCSIVESIPASAHFVELGYDVFALNYRVGGEAVAPKALEDLASAYKYIIANSSQWNLTTNEYIVNGFSAGANLSSLWGTSKRGYAAFGLPKPTALIPIYTLISTRFSKDPAIPESEMFDRFMVGSGSIDDYDVELLLDDAYPPCYIIACKDDSTVPVINSIRMKELLDNRSIPAELFLGETGEHGFGDGSDTDVEGWPEKAIAFVESLT